MGYCPFRYIKVGLCNGHFTFKTIIQAMNTKFACSNGLYITALFDVWNTG